jgi:Bacterial conjugation TrbI-like protein
MEDIHFMRRAATLILFALVAGAMVFAQNPAGTSNTPATTPQTHSPSNPNGTVAPQGTSPADLRQGSSQPVNASPAAVPNSSQSVFAANAAVVDEVGAGTEIHAELDTPLSSKTSKPGDRFTATVSEPIRANNGAAVIPSGARVEGEVAESEDGKTLAALRGKGKLSLRFRDVVLPSGQTLRLTATLISVHDTSGKNSKKADAEAQRRNINDAKVVGIGAGLGTSAGRSFGGPIKGLAIGALSGGGYVVATNGKDVNLPAQAGMLIRVDQPLTWNGTAGPMQR